ncbi:NADP-dependent oxidoreductase [Saccharopolyspora phatthalungensis]|uniref:NADPH:quinone reductase-like Zn-dependent oxidoreductase n=1 Tax=Saccharopolyspora phatthalungensis TaxID=664693 RepID=A0A840QIK5_9PSEU|nr:NADP-dependent oxidoreductase [Saccharopolyspora phatthalungensis]MBB5157243.1 NADPH:quinone reductase-like Zn-dependent oxidoreductase [Saccharopolyspora phatthalungensis]
MKAVRFHRYGNSDVLTYEEAGRPAPDAGQVLVKVAATSFNPVDMGIRSGALSGVFPLEFPHIPGIDVAGTVAELGAGVGVGVGGWQVGDAVVAFLPMNSDGAAAEYAIAPAEALAAAPRTVELTDAAALPAVGLTAWQALFELAELRAGQAILINGAAGAVGGYAVQLAKQAGAVVTATAKGHRADRLRGYGADRIIGYLDYTTTPFTAEAAPFDVVFNLVTTTPDETAALAGLVRDGGALVSTTTPPPENPGRGIRAARVFVLSKADQLAELVSRVDAGQLRIDVADRRPLADLPAVHEEAATGRLAGKTVLLPA